MLYLSSILGVDLFPIIVSHGGYRTMILEEGMTTIYSMYLSYCLNVQNIFEVNLRVFCVIYEYIKTWENNNRQNSKFYYFHS